MNIGIVFFKLPPDYNRSFDNAVVSRRLEERLLEKGHCQVSAEVSSPEDVERAAELLRGEHAGCVIFFFRHWTRIALAVALSRTLDLPIALYAQTGGGFNGTASLTAVSAVLRETPSGEGKYGHERFMEGMEDELCDWVDSAVAFSLLRESRLMCWGGFYGADMPYTRSDPDWLESRIIREVMTEQESVLTTKADEMMASGNPRVKAFIDWLMRSGVTISEDGKMVTGKSLSRQAALYLAARERLSELGGENIRGVSLKCHFELSTKLWGCTGCFLPAFLPFSESGGSHSEVIPVACEGDLNGLVSLMMLHAVNGKVPPLFGDFVEYGKEYVLMRNCGASSVYWAACSDNPADCLEKTELLPNMHGKSGAAVHYETPATESVTLLRIFRLKGEFRAFIGRARVLGENESSRYPDPWPHTRLDFSTDNGILFQTYPCNHASITMGDYTRQLEYLCGFAGIRTHRMDSNESLAGFKAEFRDRP